MTSMTPRLTLKALINSNLKAFGCIWRGCLSCQPQVHDSVHLHFKSMLCFGWRWLFFSWGCFCRYWLLFAVNVQDTDMLPETFEEMFAGPCFFWFFVDLQTKTPRNRNNLPYYLLILPCLLLGGPKATCLAKHNVVSKDPPAAASSLSG